MSNISEEISERCACAAFGTIQSIKGERAAKGTKHTKWSFSITTRWRSPAAATKVRGQLNLTQSAVDISPHCPFSHTANRPSPPLARPAWQACNRVPLGKHAIESHMRQACNRVPLGKHAIESRFASMQSSPPGQACNRVPRSPLSRCRMVFSTVCWKTFD